MQGSWNPASKVERKDSYYLHWPEDLENFITTALNSFHKLQIDYGGIVPISDLGIEYPKIYKVTKFACKALKGRGVKSGIRLTYAYFEDNDIIEFIEIYFKADKENEDRERITPHISWLVSDESRSAGYPDSKIKSLRFNLSTLRVDILPSWWNIQVKRYYKK